MKYYLYIHDGDGDTRLVLCTDGEWRPEESVNMHGWYDGAGDVQYFTSKAIAIRRAEVEQASVAAMEKRFI